MTLRFLPEHVEKVLLVMELAQREGGHLTYTHRTLFAENIDLVWVEALASSEIFAEKIDAFVSRFARLQDHISEKLIPRFAALLGENPKSMLDVLAYAEKMEWLDNTELFLGTRKLRNLLVHEYMTDPQLFLESLHAANLGTPMLLAIVDKLAAVVSRLGLEHKPHK
ncbi:MAG: hypothetical protein NT142_09145 [Planctomycetota bacterium]|nr:hypothetical protein [Planctomycetota bacterium]